MSLRSLVTRVPMGVVVLLWFAAAGCGDGGSASDRTMTVVGTEMAFDAPASVPAGDYSVTFRNDGAVHHELAFKAPNGEFAARRSVGPGQSIQMEIELEPGTWELGCFEPGHYQGGMHRELLVQADEG